MKSLELLQELAKMVNSAYLVMTKAKEEEDLLNEFYAINSNGDTVLNIPLEREEWEVDEGTLIARECVIELGFNHKKYCSYYLFTFLHELGHLVNGHIEEDLVYITRMANLPNHPRERQKEYIQIPDEWYAWEWAYDFIKNNKDYVKKLDRELGC